MELSEILNYLITLLALIVSLLAWVSKLKWSKEFKEAKEAEIKAKIAQMETIEEKVHLYESIISKKLIEYSKQTIQDLELLLNETEKANKEEINNILETIKESGKTFQEKYSYDENIITILSHELRTPINAILGFNRLLKATTDEEKKVDYHKIIESAGMQVLSVTEDLASWLKSQQEINKLIHNKYKFDETKVVE